MGCLLQADEVSWSHSRILQNFRLLEGFLWGHRLSFSLVPPPLGFSFPSTEWETSTAFHRSNYQLHRLVWKGSLLGQRQEHSDFTTEWQPTISPELQKIIRLKWKWGFQARKHKEEEWVSALNSCLWLMSLGCGCPQPWYSWGSMMLEEPRPQAPGLENGLEQTRVSVLHFGGETGKGPKGAASNF